MRRHQEHILQEPRLVAAAGFIALGGGVGLALMLARILIYVGLGVAIASAFAVFWIYARHFRLAYRSITSRTPYRGPRPSELLVAIAMPVLLLAISAAAFSVVIVQEQSNLRATFDLGIPEFVKIPASAPTGFLNVRLSNVGGLPAENVRVLMKGILVTGVLDANVVNNELDALEHALQEAEKSGTAMGFYSQVRAANAAVITLSSISATEWPNLLSNRSKPAAILISDAQWADFQQGKLTIYVLYVARFEDEGHKSSYWRTTNCAYYVGKTNFSHNCAANRIDLVSGAR